MRLGALLINRLDKNMILIKTQNGLPARYNIINNYSFFSFKHGLHTDIIINTYRVDIIEEKRHYPGGGGRIDAKRTFLRLGVTDTEIRAEGVPK